MYYILYTYNPNTDFGNEEEEEEEKEKKREEDKEEEGIIIALACIKSILVRLRLN